MNGTRLAALAATLGLLAAAGPTQAETTPIVIGATADQTGFASMGAGLAQAKVFDVWAKWINDRGGILGHPVVVVSRDTKSDPVAGAKVLSELLNDPKVVAVVHGGNDTGAGAVVAAAKVPVINAINDQDLGYANANVFPVSTTANTAEEAIGRLGVNSNKQHPNGGALHAAFAVPVIPMIREGARKAGGELISVEPTPAAPDYAALCATLKAKDVGWMAVLDLPAIVSNLSEACAKIGYTPKWVIVSGFYTADWLKVPPLDGMKIILPNAPLSGESTALKEFREAVAKYDPDLLKAPYFGEYSLMGWTALQLVAKAIEGAHPTGAEVTREDVYRGLYVLKNETLGGLTPPLTYARGKPTTIACYFVAEIKSGKLVAAAKPVC